MRRQIDKGGPEQLAASIPQAGRPTVAVTTGRKKKRDRLKSLKKEIEKSRAQKRDPQLDLLDLMKLD
jgi:hypothetical protein